jgi:hypothetical protein
MYVSDLFCGTFAGGSLPPKPHPYMTDSSYTHPLSIGWAATAHATPSVLATAIVDDVVLVQT